MKLYKTTKIAKCGLACGNCGKCPEETGLTVDLDGEIRTSCCDGQVWFQGIPLDKDGIMAKVAQYKIRLSKRNIEDELDDDILAKNIDKMIVEAKKKSPKQHGFIDQCIKENKDKEDPGAYCASIVDKVKGTTNWRKKSNKNFVLTAKQKAILKLESAFKKSARFS